MLSAAAALALEEGNNLSVPLANEFGSKTEAAKGAGKGSRTLGYKIHWPNQADQWVISKAGAAKAWGLKITQLVQRVEFSSTNPLIAVAFEKLLLIGGGGLHLTQAVVGADPSAAKARNWPPK